MFETQKRFFKKVIIIVLGSIGYLGKKNKNKNKIKKKSCVNDSSKTT